MTTAPRRGVLRLVVLGLTLAGFVAMHGLASAATGEVHCGTPAALLLPGEAHATGDQPAHSMVGCLLALLGTLVAIARRLLGGRGPVIVFALARQASAWLHTARGPPDPLFLSLCVFRL